MPCQKMPRKYRRKPSMSGRVRRNSTQEFVMRKHGAGGPKRSRFLGAAAAAGLMPCSKKYLASLMDPSGDVSRGACIPAGFPIPSQKVRAFYRGTMVTGTNGNGYVALNPTIAGDYAAVSYSTGGTASITDPFSSANYAGATQTMPKLPYSTAELASGTVQGRFVSGCVRVRYAGSEDVRSGLITMLEDPDHLSLIAQNPGGLATFEGATRERPNGDGKWSQINWSGPAKTEEVEYVTTPAQTAVNWPIVIAVSGTNDASGVGAAIYEFEAWINCEYIGRDVVGKTDNINDAAGFDKVLSATKSVANTAQQALNPGATGVVSQVLNAHGGETTMAGDILQGVASAINPGLGKVWGVGRSILRSVSRSRSTTRRPRSYSVPYRR